MQRLKCLIALVPDPLDSHLPLTFDNRHQFDRSAFRDQGFVRDRQSFLWQYGSKGTTMQRSGAVARAAKCDFVPKDRVEKSGSTHEFHTLSTTPQSHS